MKAYTDIEQSKKLAEILPLESADMSYQHFVPDLLPEGYCISVDKVKYETDIPCWSLAKLLDILPKIYGAKPILDLEVNSIQYTGINLYVVADNPVDACVAMIEKLHEQNLL